MLMEFVGTGATSAKEQGISIGNLSMVNGKNSIALGTNSKVVRQLHIIQ